MKRRSIITDLENDVFQIVFVHDTRAPFLVSCYGVQFAIYVWNISQPILLSFPQQNDNVLL